jgi:hypothetical protein
MTYSSSSKSRFRRKKRKAKEEVLRLTKMSVLKFVTWEMGAGLTTTLLQKFKLDSTEVQR